MHCCNINKSRRGGFLFGSPGTYMTKVIVPGQGIPDLKPEEDKRTHFFVPVTLTSAR